MCGICYLFRGVPIHSHHFTFDFFADYLNNEHTTDSPEVCSLSQHVLNEKLLIDELELQDIHRI